MFCRGKVFFNQILDFLWCYQTPLHGLMCLGKNIVGIKVKEIHKILKGKSKENPTPLFHFGQGIELIISNWQIAQMESGTSVLSDIFNQIAQGKLAAFKQINRVACEPEISIEKHKDFTVAVLKLKLINQANEKIQFNYAYPNLSFSLQKPIEYFIPTSPIVYSNENGKFAFNYGSRLPFPFAAVKQIGRGQSLMLLISDPKGRFKEFRLQKNREILKMSAIYYDIILQPSAQLELPAIKAILFTTKQNFIFQASKLYKQVDHHNLEPKQSKEGDKFDKSFVMRVLQIYEIEWHSSHRRVDIMEPINLRKLISADEEKIGKIQYVHLRDWSSENRQITKKFGNYLTQKMIGPHIQKQELQRQIDLIRTEKEIGLGLYFEGYLVSKSLFRSNIQMLQRLQSMLMKDEQGNGYKIWGSANLTMCVADQHWRQLLIKSIINVVKNLSPNAIYIDEFGFGSRTSGYKICTNQQHKHEQFDLQVSELEFIKSLRQTMKQQNIALYVQQCPHDLMMKEISGSLNTGTKKALKTGRVPLLIQRFMFPSFKVYQIITQYTMNKTDILCNGHVVDNNVENMIKAIVITFWNGNGIYIPKNLDYYDESVLGLIKLCNNYFSLYNHYFRGSEVQPLVGYTLFQKNQLLVNKFCDKNGQELFTLLNLSESLLNASLGGEMIEVRPGQMGIFVEDHFFSIHKIKL